jgi:hypothetical protein
MGFGSSKFQAIVDDKRARRDKLLSSAPEYVESEHGPCIQATGMYFQHSRDAALINHSRAQHRRSLSALEMANGQRRMSLNRTLHAPHTHTQ